MGSGERLRWRGQMAGDDFASSQAFQRRRPLPKRFCNLDRLLHALEARGLDGIVATLPSNVFYLSGFNGIAHKSDEPRVCVVLLSRHVPGHPVMVVADYYLATFLTQPTWIEDIRPFRAVMMPLDLRSQESDIDRFIPPASSGEPWVERARKQYTFDMGSAVKGAARELKRPGQSRHRRPGLRPQAQHRRAQRRRRLRPDDVRPIHQDARRARPRSPRDTPQRDGHPQDDCLLAKGCNLARPNIAYTRSVAELGGFVRDPGGMVWGHARGNRQRHIATHAAPLPRRLQSR